MKITLLSLGIFLSINACQTSKTPIITDTTKPVENVISNTNEQPPQSPEELEKWITETEFLMAWTRFKDGSEFVYMDEQPIGIQKNSMSFKQDCNGCVVEILLDNKAQKITFPNHRQSPTCTQLECADPADLQKHGIAIPPKAPCDLVAFEGLSYRREGKYYLVLTNNCGEHWLRVSPNEQERKPKSLENTQWQIVQYRKLSDSNPNGQYPNYPIDVQFGTDYLGLSPDCNGSTMKAQMSYTNNTISWTGGKDGFMSTTMACPKEKISGLSTDLIEQGMKYEFNHAYLVLTGKNYQLWLRRIVFRN